MSNAVPCRPKKKQSNRKQSSEISRPLHGDRFRFATPFKRGNSTQILSRIIFNENFGENCDSLGSLSQHGIHNKKDASLSCISWNISIICNI